MTYSPDDTIMALATPSGAGAIAVIRISGKDAFAIADNIFRAKGNKTISKADSHTIIFGDVLDGDELVDEVLVSVFAIRNRSLEKIQLRYLATAQALFRNVS